jgi:hypothetical protein
LLAAQAEKSILFTVDPDSVGRPVTVRFTTSEENLSKDVQLKGHFSPSPLILLLTDNSVSPSIPLPPDSPAHVISLSLDELPSDTRAYQGVWAVLFYEQSLRDLSRSQRLALESWLTSGGRILVLGGLQYALYQEPPMTGFLPVRVVGLKRLSTLPSLGRYYGADASSLSSLLVQNSRLLEGNVLIEERGTPILVEMARGKGRVFYLSLDVGRPPLSRWEGLPTLFTDLLGAPSERKPGLWTIWDDSILSKLLRDRSFSGSHLPVMTFLLCLLFYFGGLFFLVRLWQLQRFSHAALAAASVIFVTLMAVGGYLYFDGAYHIPDGILVSSTLLQSDQTGDVEVQTNVGFLASRRRDFSFQVKNGWTDMDVIPSRSARGKDMPVAVQDRTRSTSLRFPLREWDHKLFSVHSAAPFPVRLEVDRVDNSLALKLTNVSRGEIRDCWLLISGRGLSLGKIRAGGSIDRKIPLSSEGLLKDGQGDTVGLWEIPFSDRAREVIIRHSIFPQGQVTGRWGGVSAFLLGWVEGNSPTVWVDDGRILSRHFTLFRIILPLGGEDES